MRVLLILCVVGVSLAAHALERPGFETLERVRLLRGVVQSHEAATGELPKTGGHLGVLVRLYDPRVPLQQGLPVDGWGRPFVYRAQASGELAYSLYSQGPNGADDSGEGDDLGAKPGTDVPGNLRRAQQLFPLVLIVTIGPMAFAAIRRARRSVTG